MNSILNDVFKFVRSRPKKRIGIAILRPSDKIIESLKLAQRYVDVVIVGSKVENFSSHQSTEEKAARTLIEFWEDNEINQIVRGQVDDFTFMELFSNWRNIPEHEKSSQFALLRDASGREFFLATASNPEAHNFNDKLRITNNLLNFLSSYFPNLKPKIAVMATCRPLSYDKNNVLSQSFDDAEKLVSHLNKKGLVAKNVNIEIEEALNWANIVVPADGSIGNQIFRTLVYLGDGQNLFSPCFYPTGAAYENCSRNEEEWLNHLVFASYMAGQDD